MKSLNIFTLSKKLSRYRYGYMTIYFILLFFVFSEIGKVRGNLFQINGKKNEPLVLPDAAGPSISLSEKVYVPIKEFPDVSNNNEYDHNLVPNIN